MSTSPTTARAPGRALVLLHPLGADRKVWRPVLDRLTAERDVICVDLPGFGDSPALARHRARPRGARRAPWAACSVELGVEAPRTSPATRSAAGSRSSSR